MFPITIVDNFLEDPDAIVRLSEQMEFKATTDGKWPGARTDQLWEHNHRLFNSIGIKIHSLFYEGIVDNWSMTMHFQKISPFDGDKWNKKNRGWIHKDLSSFGGIIYLSKDPDADSGTSIYKCKNGYQHQYPDELQVKEDLYTGKSTLSQDEYDKVFDAVNDQFVETVTVENVYNRLLLFGGQTYHGVKTFGTKPRLTLNFFGYGVKDDRRYSPLERF